VKVSACLRCAAVHTIASWRLQHCSVVWGWSDKTAVISSSTGLIWMKYWNANWSHSAHCALKFQAHHTSLSVTTYCLRHYWSRDYKAFQAHHTCFTVSNNVLSETLLIHGLQKLFKRITLVSLSVTTYRLRHYWSTDYRIFQNLSQTKIPVLFSPFPSPLHSSPPLPYPSFP